MGAAGFGVGYRPSGSGPRSSRLSGGSGLAWALGPAWRFALSSGPSNPKAAKPQGTYSSSVLRPRPQTWLPRGHTPATRPGNPSTSHTSQPPVAFVALETRPSLSESDLVLRLQETFPETLVMTLFAKGSLVWQQVRFEYPKLQPERVPPSLPLPWLLRGYPLAMGPGAPTTGCLGVLGPPSWASLTGVIFVLGHTSPD